MQHAVRLMLNASNPASAHKVLVDAHLDKCLTVQCAKKVSFMFIVIISVIHVLNCVFEMIVTLL